MPKRPPFSQKLSSGSKLAVSDSNNIIGGFSDDNGIGLGFTEGELELARDRKGKDATIEAGYACGVPVGLR